jgi:hypothetical protein
MVWLNVKFFWIVFTRKVKGFWKSLIEVRMFHKLYSWLTVCFNTVFF